MPVELTLPGTSNGSASGGSSTTTGTPGFSEEFIGMVYELNLDSTTWDILALYDTQWGVEAYDDANALIGSTYDGSDASRYVNALKFIASNSIAMTSPSIGSTLDKSDPAPTFQWDTYQGVSTYLVVLALVGSLGFDTIDALAAAYREDNHPEKAIKAYGKVTKADPLILFFCTLKACLS